MTGNAERIFHEARGLMPSEQAAYLERECGGDAALRAKVEGLLKADTEAGAFLRTAGEASSAAMEDKIVAASLPEGPGTRIGAYKLLQLIGEGGFGSVFMAEQERPVARKVALKIIKLGMDTRQVVARFEQERQALALMDHPNIARVLDAGATDAGRPYFVMELVKGDPIVEYCDKNNLSIEERLELFAQVCTAVQHAHTKGIIHRDIKPSNILVSTQDGRPHTKVIDFGIAKATASKLTEKTLFTEHRALIGTPEYMSPEQAEGNLDIDTRTDVYSLGVLLYELLTGTTPFTSQELRSAAYAEIQRIIREVEPPKPSTRLSQNTGTIASVAAKRHTEPKRLGTIVRGELDWIVMKALEKDRQRRYETANGLAMDVRRYLAGEAVLAAPPSTAYRFKKFIRRNRVMVTAGSMVAAALVLGIVGFAWQAHRVGVQRDAAVAARTAEQAARKAEKEEREKAEAINDFVRTALKSSDPHQGGTQGMLVADAMSNAAKLLDEGAFKGQPDIEASLRDTISQVLNGNARSADALVMAERALAIHEQLHPGDHVDVARSLGHVGDCLGSLGRHAEAQPKYEAALEMYQRLFPGDHVMVADGLNSVACGISHLGRPGKAVPKHQAALDMLRRLFQGDHAKIAEVQSNLGFSLYNVGRTAKALVQFEASLEMDRRLHKGDHPDVAADLNNVSMCLNSLDRPAEALPRLEEALEMYQRLFKGDYPEVARGLVNRAECLRRLRRWPEAVPNFKSGTEMWQRLFPSGHPETASSLSHLANCLASLDRLPEALEYAQRAADMAARVLPDGHPIRKACDDNLAEIRARMTR